MIYRSPRCFLPSFKSIGLSIQEKKRKIDFHDDGHLRFPIGLILVAFDLQVTPILLTKFQVSWPFDSGEEAKNRFSRWWPRRPSWISDRKYFSYFWSTGHPDASYKVSSQLTIRLRKRKEKWIFKMAAILDFYCFFIYKSPWCFLRSVESVGLLVRERKRKIYFQDGSHSCHLEFPLITRLAFFYVQVIQMLPTKFQVKCPFGSEKEAKNRFSRWRPSSFSCQNGFSYFQCTSHFDASYQVSSQMAQGCRRSKLLNQLLAPLDARRTTLDGYWLTTIAHLELTHQTSLPESKIRYPRQKIRTCLTTPIKNISVSHFGARRGAISYEATNMSNKSTA